MARPTTPPRLLAGPYPPPSLRRGDRTFCLYRDADVTVTSWTSAPIPWPRCCRPGTHGGGSGLLVTEELARAVRTESAAAVCYWWGVTPGVVWRWRKELGVTRTNNEGTRQLIQAAAEAGAEALRYRGLSDEQCEQRSRTAVRLNLKRFLHPGYHGPRWTPEQLQLLGKEPDHVVAGKVGRSVTAVRIMRQRLGLPSPAARPGANGSPRWSAAEDDLVRRLSPAEAARRTGRTLAAVYSRRSLLWLKGVPADGERST
jgi:hypothetical protein